MLYWSLMFLLVALTAGLLVIAFTAAGARKILPGPNPHPRWDSETHNSTLFRRMRVSALAARESVVPASPFHIGGDASLTLQFAQRRL